MNPGAEGKRYPEVPFEVTAERVAAFRSVFPDGGTSVPPTFLTVAEFEMFPTIVEDPELGLDFSRVIHSEQEYEWRRPLRVAETLVARSRIASIRQRGALGFLTIETEIADADGVQVARCLATMIERAPA